MARLVLSGVVVAVAAPVLLGRYLHCPLWATAAATAALLVGMVAARVALERAGRA